MELLSLSLLVLLSSAYGESNDLDLFEEENTTCDSPLITFPQVSSILQVSIMQLAITCI